MANATWPAKEDRSLIGKRISRIDGPAKTTGRAQYAYDINLPGMLWGRVTGSDHAHARVKSIDLSAAKNSPGVKAVWKDEELIGEEVRYIGQIIAAVAADTEERATEAIKKVKIDYEVLEHQVVDDDPAHTTGRASNREEGDVEQGFKDADVVVENSYGVPVITHCCLEPHGQTAEVRNGELFLWPSTQNVSRYADRLDDAVGIPRAKMHVNCQYMGGGFGSKFGHDKWGIIGSLLSKETGRPVKLLLERDQEMQYGGSRPSAFGTVKVGAKKDGNITAFEANVWGTSGGGGYNMSQVLPYVFKTPTSKVTSQGIRTNRGAQRAWRAPRHPQANVLTMSAIEDTAAALNMDALEFFKTNLGLTDRPEVYDEQLDIAAKLIGYHDKAHLRGDKTAGPIKRGLGIAIHTWGGLGHPSECDVTINPDGSVVAEMGTQDLGTGARTTLAIIAGETLGLPIEAITVKIGRNSYPASGASGGSTTIGGTSTATRHASTDALNELLKVAAPELGATADELEAKAGRIRVINHPSNSMSWSEACSLLGPNTITKRGVNDRAESQKSGYIDAGVGGVQMADVSVDIETGVVTMNEMVAVQDCGLIIDMKTAESQVFGALIMGITYGLYEEAIYDPTTGKMLNADMEYYRLAGYNDIGKLKVHMMTGKKYEDRGIIGLGEPPAISPGGALSNAVANACGVRVPSIPLTPDRVIAALQDKGIV
jgi:xanthine dehydrogenase YagR molybdenum-binding subunit